MELIIVRHGIAQDRGAPGVRRDADRALTEEGIRRTREAARGLRVLGIRPGCIATSPLVRARETADILGEVLAPDVSVETCKELAGGGDLHKLVRWTAKRDAEQVMLVGHMPDVADLCALLLSRGRDLDMVFKKAAACCVTFSGAPRAGGGRLAWLIQPRALRALADAEGDAS